MAVALALSEQCRTEGKWVHFGATLKDLLMSKVEVTEYISPGEIEEIMDLEKYIGSAVEQVEAVVGRLRANRYKYRLY